MEFNNVASYMRAFRAKHNITARETALVMEISQAFLSLIETEQKPIPRERFEKFLEVVRKYGESTDEVESIYIKEATTINTASLPIETRRLVHNIAGSRLSAEQIDEINNILARAKNGRKL